METEEAMMPRGPRSEAGKTSETGMYEMDPDDILNQFKTELEEGNIPYWEEILIEFKSSLDMQKGQAVRFLEEKTDTLSQLDS